MESQDDDEDTSQLEWSFVVLFILSLIGYVHSPVLTMTQQNYYKVPYFRRE